MEVDGIRQQLFQDCLPVEATMAATSLLGALRSRGLPPAGVLLYDKSAPIVKVNVTGSGPIRVDYRLLADVYGLG